MRNKIFTNKLVDETAPEEIWLVIGDEGNYEDVISVDAIRELDLKVTLHEPILKLLGRC